MTFAAAAVRRLQSVAASILLAVCWPLCVLATKPANVLVVVNQTSDLSRTVADYYVSKRGIPKQNVCTIKTTTNESISRAVYDKEISAPIAHCLKSRGLVESIL